MKQHQKTLTLLFPTGLKTCHRLVKIFVGATLSEAGLDGIG